jgi:hypothetical protein
VVATCPVHRLAERHQRRQRLQARKLAMLENPDANVTFRNISGNFGNSGNDSNSVPVSLDEACDNLSADIGDACISVIKRIREPRWRMYSVEHSGSSTVSLSEDDEEETGGTKVGKDDILEDVSLEDEDEDEDEDEEDEDGLDDEDEDGIEDEDGDIDMEEDEDEDLDEDAEADAEEDEDLDEDDDEHEEDEDSDALTDSSSASASASASSGADVFSPHESSDSEPPSGDESFPYERNLIALTQSYAIRKRLAVNADTVVYEGRCRVTGARVAVKVRNEWCRNKHDKELRIMAALQQHRLFPRVVASHRFKSTKTVALAMEFCEGSSDVTALFGRPWVIKTYMRSVLEALSFMHTRNVLYRDVKPSNIIYHERSAGGGAGRDGEDDEDADVELVVKLMDFDVSTFSSLYKDKPQRRYVGTDGYMRYVIVIITTKS